jgi:hypothetical protein
MTALPDGYVMSIQTVTCTQDRQSGTRTTLELVATWMLNDSGIAADQTGLNPMPDKAQQNPGTPAPAGSQILPNQEE